MSIVLRYSSAALGILQRDAAVFISYRLRFVAQVASTLFTLLLFYYISKLVRVDTFPTPEDYFAFVTVGLVIFGVLTSTLAVGPATLRQELVAGTFERLVVSPFGAVPGVLCDVDLPVCIRVLQGVVSLLLAALVFGLPLEWPSAVLALPVAFFGVLAFLPFGVLVTAAVVVLKQAMAVGNFLVAGISVVAGLYFPVALLPGWIQWTSDVQPFTPAVDLLRHLLVGTPLQSSAWVEIGKLALFAAVLIPASIWVLHKAVGMGRRRATIMEY